MFINTVYSVDSILGWHSMFMTTVSKITRLFVLLLLITQASTQDSRSVAMTKMVGWQFQCVSTTCMPLRTFTMWTLLNCQTACLFNAQCQAVNFHASSSICALFGTITSPMENIVSDADTITAIIIAGTRIPPG